MTRNDAIAILRILKANYHNFFRTMAKQDAEDIIQLWATMFDEPVEIVTEAVKAAITTKKDFPPTIADVKEKIRLICTGPDSAEDLSEMEAWNLVKNAISYYNAGSNFERLPLFLQRLVGSPSQLREWALMETDTLNTVVQSNFMRSYKSRSLKAREFNLLPESTKQLISGLTKQLALEDGGTE